MLLAAAGLFPSLAAEAGKADPARPNILLIVIDDLGYSDLGAYGGEIRTPNMDALAKSGVRMADFHAAAGCSPARAMLLTGIDNHINGLGNLIMAENQLGQPGYEDRLNQRAVTVAALLREAGYRTYMAGKWDLGSEAGSRPEARGFQRSFAMTGSYPGSHFDLTPSPWNEGPAQKMFEDGQPVAELPPDFFSTEFYASRMIEYLQSGDLDQPFFAYLAFSAVHWPLQAPPALLNRYRGRYDEGYDQLRKERLARMRSLGIVGARVRKLPENPGVPAWEALPEEEQRRQARFMEIYAAMLEHVDASLGRLLGHLRDAGQYQNTIVLLLSDNGPAGVSYDAPALTEAYLAGFDNSLANLGRPGSLAIYGPGWAQASATPLRLFKHFTTEGGLRVPLIISGHQVARANEIHRGFVHITDIAPSLLELAGAEYPEQYRGRPLPPLKGKSLLPYLQGRAERVRGPDDILGFELAGHRGLRQGQWKLSLIEPPRGSGAWQLFNLAEDIGEFNDLAAQEPERLAALVALWQRYAEEVNLILPEGPAAVR